MSDDAQPDQGQGSPFAEYVDRFPEEIRPQAEEIFREWDGNVTKRFQDASETTKQFEPYREMLQGRQPDEVQWGLQFHEAASSNPQAVKEWYESYAQQHGLITEPEPAAVTFDQFGDEPDVTALLDQRLAPLTQQLEQFGQWQQQQEQAARQQEASQIVRSQLDEIKKNHPDEYDEEWIEKLLPRHIDSDPRNAVSNAFADLQALRAQIEKQTLQGKVNTSTPAAESGGLADGAPEPIKTLKDANAAALEQLRGAQAA